MYQTLKHKFYCNWMEFPYCWWRFSRVCCFSICVAFSIIIDSYHIFDFDVPCSLHLSRKRHREWVKDLKGLNWWWHTFRSRWICPSVYFLFLLEFFETAWSKENQKIPIFLEKFPPSVMSHRLPLFKSEDEKCETRFDSNEKRLMGDLFVIKSFWKGYEQKVFSVLMRSENRHLT